MPVHYAILELACGRPQGRRGQSQVDRGRGSKTV